MKTDSSGIHYTRLEVVCPETHRDILIAELAEAGFAMFMETDSGFEADAEEGEVDPASIEAIRERYSQDIPLIFRVTSVQKENWNELWEKNVSPVVIEDQCLIRAAFHKIDHQYPYEIVITPKMSFGTGHHPTTHLMVKSQLAIDHEGKRVMDAGCGTAILSVMACKRGAIEVEAFDIDEWSILNGQENAALNQCSQIRIRQGTIADFEWEYPFDIILANINRNILLKEMPQYVQRLAPGGILQMSGFYVKDIPELTAEAGRYGLVLASQADREEWATIGFTRKPK